MSGTDESTSQGSTLWGSLMAAAQDGDRAAYGRLLAEATPYIRAIVRRHHGSGDRVDDVVQDVLLCIHRVRHTYDPARPFIHWLGAIAHRRSVDALRRRVRIEAVETFNEQAYETFAAPPANDGMETKQTNVVLGRAIAALPQGQRQAVELLKLKELSLTEAADASGQSAGALKVSLHRALKTLRKSLAGKVDHHG